MTDDPMYLEAIDRFAAVIAEAKQYGLPVVATAVGGIPEMMRALYPETALVRPGAVAGCPRPFSHTNHE